MNSTLTPTPAAEIGDTFGKWEVVGPVERRDGLLFLPCRCACGETRLVRASRLVGQISQSCGRCRHGGANAAQGAHRNTSFYLTLDGRRRIDELAALLELPKTRIVELALRECAQKNGLK